MRINLQQLVNAAIASVKSHTAVAKCAFKLGSAVAKIRPR